jgi:hypothetical protein
MGSLMPLQQPQNRASHLPLVALACTVVLAAALPIAAATAGGGWSRAAGGEPPQITRFTESGAEGGERSGSETGAAGGTRGGPAGDVPGARSASYCGAGLAAVRGGLHAQPCVLSDGEDAWARAYYRNGTGSQLRGALTLTRPDGTSLRADCALPSRSGEGMCETPRERVREAPGGARRYSATVDIGTPDGERLLLRSVSNSQA